MQFSQYFIFHCDSSACNWWLRSANANNNNNVANVNSNGNVNNNNVNNNNGVAPDCINFK